MAGPLLPFAYDQSRQDENLPPLNLSQPRQKGRSTNDTDDVGGNFKNKGVDYESDTDRHSYEGLEKENDLKPKPSKFLYSSINSSSSVLVENNQPVSSFNSFTNTSSTILDFHSQNLSSDSFHQLDNNNVDVPSSPFHSQSVFNGKPDPLSSDAFDDLVSVTNNFLDSKPSLPSSPTLLPLSQTSTQLKKDSFTLERNSKFQRPKLNKQLHPLSRHGSTFAEPTRKKQRMIQKEAKIISSTPPLITNSNVEFAIDRDGHVYGYKLEKDELPQNYFPTLYDEPIYFVVKNSPSQEQNLLRTIDEFFEQPVSSTKPISTLNLQYFNLSSLPDYICDIQNFYDCADDGIVKPLIHIDASYNKLRSINPKLLTIERLEMLSLRNNKIARLSGNIDKAKDLISLNLAMNKFKFLPHNILKLRKLEVLATTGNPMISQASVDKFYAIDFELLKLYSDQTNSIEFLDTDKQILSFSRIHWLKSNKQISKNAVHASMLSRSLSTIQDLCYDDNGNLKDWDDFESNNKLKLRKKKQSFVQSKLPWCPKLTELALRQVSKYLISQSEVQKWKDSTSEFIYKRAMNSLIYGTNGETCGNCNENCIESVADMLEWWEFKGSKSVTIKRRFCSKHCATCWLDKLNKFKLADKKQNTDLNRSC
ncbi:hypothetical protein PMKS-002139 [Pichia membranifaciens]|uniref:Uncharacterized protein n=1 Tax=Pichia membranifaciens TaxID=4926 RepID=A0A1Q2YGQ8_9ASCO|nr:hypothetical protein PMKS-002139 [Pichia membranifaciens]